MIVGIDVTKPGSKEVRVCITIERLRRNGRFWERHFMELLHAPPF